MPLAIHNLLLVRDTIISNNSQEIYALDTNASFSFIKCTLQKLHSLPKAQFLSIYDEKLTEIVIRLLSKKHLGNGNLVNSFCFEVDFHQK